MTEIDVNVTAEETRLIRTAMNEIQKDYELPGSDDPLAFHNRSHTAGVIRRASLIAKMAGLDERTQILVRLGAAFHDAFQSSELVTPASIFSTRRRMIGINEAVSAMGADAELASSSLAFTGLERSIVRQAIVGTTPAWDTENHTVYQPLVAQDSHPVVHCVALADLGEAGMDSEAFVKGSYTLFAEDNPGFVTLLKNADRVRDIPDRLKLLLQERLLNWLKTQALFARGRGARAPQELAWLGPELSGRIQASLFNQFGRSAMMAHQNYCDGAHSTSFKDLMRKVLPTAFPAEE